MSDTPRTNDTSLTDTERVDELIDALNDTDALRSCPCPSCNFYAPDYEQHKGEPCSTWALIEQYVDARILADRAASTAIRDEAAAERREKIIEALSWLEDEDGRWGHERASDVLTAHEEEWCGRAASTVHTDEGLRARIEALAEGWKREAGQDRDMESRTLRAVVAYLRTALDASPAPTDNRDDERRVRDEWADYFEHWTQAVGPEPLTVETVIAILRAEHKPFGVAAALAPTTPTQNHPQDTP